VVAFMSLQDMDDAAGAVREAARVLAPGGVLVAATVHPIASSGIARDDATERGYFEEMRTTDAIERDGIAFEFHQIHRSLQGFLGLFFAAGLVVEDLREPRPSQADVADDPPLGKNRARPAFLHLRCRHG
jgi:SAM-dependent methyltransferase